MEEPLVEERAESAAGSVIAALAFGLGVWGFLGEQKGAEYFAGYLLEQSLSGERGGAWRRELRGWQQAGQAIRRVVGWWRGARFTKSTGLTCLPITKAPLPPCPPPPGAVDNLFVFILVFNYFKTPVAYQNKVLTYGIATAAILRLVLIVAGVDIGGWAGVGGNWVWGGQAGRADEQGSAGGCCEAGAFQQSPFLPSCRLAHLLSSPPRCSGALSAGAALVCRHPRLLKLQAASVSEADWPQQQEAFEVVERDLWKLLQATAPEAGGGWALCVCLLADWQRSPAALPGLWCSTGEEEDDEDDLSDNKIVQFCKSLTKFTDTYDGDKFFTMQVRGGGGWGWVGGGGGLPGPAGGWGLYSDAGDALRAWPADQLHTRMPPPTLRIHPFCAHCCRTACAWRRRCCWCCWWWRCLTSYLLWTPSPPCLASPWTLSSSTPPTCLPSCHCGGCTALWPHS